MICPSCGRENPSVLGTYCTFCGALLGESTHFAASFAEASGYLSGSARATLSVYEDAKFWKAKPAYITKLETMKNQFLDAYGDVYSVLIETAKRDMREQMELEREKTRRTTRARDIQFIVTAIDAAFNKINSCVEEVLRQDIPGFFTELSIECENHGNFNYKVQTLCNIFEVNLRSLRSIISDPSPEWKSIKILEEWMKQKGVVNADTIVEVWRKINCLRNMPPAHPKLRSEHIEAMRFFSGGVNDLPQLWDNILDRFLSSLREFYQVLESMLPTS